MDQPAGAGGGVGGEAGLEARWPEAPLGAGISMGPVGGGGLIAPVDAASGEHSSFTALDSLPGQGPSGAYPRQIGRYEIVRLLGEGGFGSVFLAQQHHPVKRKVALKVVKLGMDTAEVLQRFEAERQALALMDHPNVARVYDAGVTERGQPFFAMEYVEGMPLAKFVDEEELTLEERLRLFIDVCRAVQHAHQKGLIHRDLKPGNILVSRVDGVPTPKVIDFGIAKATGPSLTETNFRTETGRLIGTPEYMSPEQCAGSVDIDTRTDVYALGVILYELLTGQLPFDSKSLRAGGIDGITRIIREVEPARPSARVTQAAGVDLARVVRARRTDVRHLQRAIAGDLDWIVLKALEKDRDRRYDSANALALDVQRHLGSEPVLAGPPDLRYRLGKFARRNKVLVATVSAVAAALVIGLLLATIGFVTASRARDRAEQALAAEQAARKAEQLAREAERLATADTASAAREAGVQLEAANAVKQFLTDLLASADPAKARGREVTVRDVVESAAATLDQGRFAGRPEVEVELRSTLGNTLRTLGLASLARVQLERGLAVAESSPLIGAATRYTLLNRAGLAASEAGDTEAAIGLLTRAVTWAVERFGDDSLEAAAARQNLANAHRADGSLADSERLLRRALDTYAARLPDTDPRVGIVRNNLASVHHLRGELEQAEALFRTSLKVLDRELGPDHPDTAAVCRNLALVLHDQNELGEAEVLLGRAVRVWKTVLPPEHPNYREVLDLWGDVLRDLGRLDGAAAAVTESLGIRERVAGRDSFEACEALVNLANLRQRQGRLPEALALADDLIGRASAGLDAGNREHQLAVAGYHALRGTLRLDLGQLDEAEGDVRRALAIRRELLAAADWRTANTRSLLGAILTARGEYEVAEPMLFEAHQTLRGNRDAPPVTVERSKARLQALYRATNRPDEAERVP